MGREPKVLREAHEHNCFAHRVQHVAGSTRGLTTASPRA